MMTLDDSMKRRRLLRFLSYVLLAVLTVLLLVLYLTYLSAQRLPGFYREALEIPLETQELRNKEMLRSVNNLNNSIQGGGDLWNGTFTDEQLNAYLAVEATKDDANLLPKEIREPRLSFSQRKIDFACRIEEGPVTGIVHLGLGITLPEPNRLVVRIKEARLGTLPLSREHAVEMIREVLKKKGIDVTQGREADDPTLSIPLDLKYAKKYALVLENLDIHQGTVQFSGSLEKNNPSK